LNENFGQLVFQSERQTLDFVKKYDKLLWPLLLVGVAFLFLNYGLIDWLVDNAGFYGVVGSFSDSIFAYVPTIVYWLLLVAAVIYLFYCIFRVVRFEGNQARVYQRGAELDFLQHTIRFHFDEFARIELRETHSQKKGKICTARIYLKEGTRITIDDRDFPELKQFAEQLLAAYDDYSILT